jgi:hypothetical protein
MNYRSHTEKVPVSKIVPISVLNLLVCTVNYRLRALKCFILFFCRNGEAMHAVCGWPCAPSE